MYGFSFQRLFPVSKRSSIVSMIALAQGFHSLLKCTLFVFISVLFFSMQLSKQSSSPLGAGIIVLLHTHQALCKAASVGSATAISKNVLANSLHADLSYVFRRELYIV